MNNIVKKIAVSTKTNTSINDMNAQDCSSDRIKEVRLLAEESGYG